VSDLATLEAALWRGEYHRLADSHSHRATREDSLGIIKGRDAIQAAWIADGSAAVEIITDLDGVIAVAGDGWHLHRWVWREDGRILREVVVTDRNRSLNAPPVHPPLGELRAGRGQYAAGDKAILPPNFHPDAIALADRLHMAWNGRALNHYNAEWLTQIIETLPDATFYFESAKVAGKTIAILWRIMGHHRNGQRIRLIGSSIFASNGDMTLIDREALLAQHDQPLVDYA
jgi:hypothetical protein